MMTVEDVGICVRFALAVVATYAVWRLMLVRTFNDEYRQQVFKIRGELVAMLGEEGLASDHPAYVESRNLMNKFIRYGHDLSFTKLVTLGLSRDVPDDEMKEWNAARFAGLSEQVTAKIRRLEARVFLTALRRSIITSLPAITGGCDAAFREPPWSPPNERRTRRFASIRRSEPSGARTRKGRRRSQAARPSTGPRHLSGVSQAQHARPRRQRVAGFHAKASC